MSLAAAFSKWMGETGERPSWKTVSVVDDNGIITMTDGSIAYLFSAVSLDRGDRVLVFKGIILKIKWQDVPAYSFPATSGALVDIIICHVGETTADYQKKLLDLTGRELTRLGWSLTDDGLYGLVWDGMTHDDPLEYIYTVEGGGLGVPACSSGRAAKQKNGKNCRFILNQSMEDEAFVPWKYTINVLGQDFTYDFLTQADSLTFMPLSIRTGKPFMTRYTPDRIIHIPTLWGGYTVTLELDSYVSDQWGDSLPKVKRIYHEPLIGLGRNYEGIEGDGASVASTAEYLGTTLQQQIIRALTFDAGGSLMAEPLARENYSIPPLQGASEAEQYHRCSDPNSDTCFFVDGDVISGKTRDGSGYVTDSGLSTISNDIRLPHGVNEAGELTYIRWEKDTELTLHRCGVYVGGVLVDQSPSTDHADGWEDVIRLYADDGLTHEDYNRCPIYLKKTRFAILHSHISASYNAVVYRKTSLVSYDSELLPYYIYRSYVGGYTQVRKTSVVSETTWWVVVNSRKMQLTNPEGTPYTCTGTEYRLSATGIPYTPQPGDTDITAGYLNAYPWYDVTDPYAVNITRIFMDHDTDLILGFDVFPCFFEHEIAVETRNGYKTLEAHYKTDFADFPPSSDAVYEDVAGRRWFLFGADGNMKSEITLPKTTSGSVTKDWPRVNGLALIQGG